MKIQSRSQYLKFVVTNEFYMIRIRELYNMDLILMQITMKPYLPFIGACVLLFGEPAQLPPLIGYSTTLSVGHGCTRKINVGLFN